MDKEKAIDRARKLMAMAADSSSPHEAAIAARRARAIMDEHQLGLGDLAEKSEFGSVTAGKARQHIPLWEQSLCIWIANLNDCVARFDGLGRFVFSGFDEDAEVCKFMFFYLTENGRRTCKEFIKQKPWGCRNSFKLHYAHAVTEKIQAILEARKEQLKTSTGKSLVLVKKGLVEKQFGTADYGKTKRKIEVDYDSAIAGLQAGERTNIVTGVESGN